MPQPHIPGGSLDPERVLRMTRRFAAAPERVFDAWLRPETARRWLFASAADEAYRAEIDARVGGRYEITARREGVDYTAVGEYLEIDRPRRLVFTFAMPQFSPEADWIIVELAPDGAGCLLTFTQQGLPPEYHAATEEGWSLMFELLAALLA
ncbi:MAG TPA: SRPBCC domain-containing protein [Herpetosiphonaceae bacterium]